MELLENEAIKVADGLYIENVLNEFLPNYFLKRGYVQARQENIPSFYKFNSRE